MGRQLVQCGDTGIGQRLPQIRWDAVALSPGDDGVDGDAAKLGEAGLTGVRYNLSMGPHSQSMHYAQTPCKRLLHRGRSYRLCMSTPNERLRRARERFFKSAAEAARAMGVPVGTYSGHENGHRGFPAGRAPEYARRFKVSPEWLLYGKGDEPEPTNDLTDDDLTQMVENALRELPAGVPLGDFPRLIAPALREQLERFQDDRERHA